MPQQEDRDYYARRTLEELAQAELAIDATAAAIHYDLADRYFWLQAGAFAGQELSSLQGARFRRYSKIRKCDRGQ